VDGIEKIGRKEKVEDTKECIQKCEESASCQVVQIERKRKKGSKSITCILSDAVDDISSRLKKSKKTVVHVKEVCEGNNSIL